jgi:hypothetical protein
MRAADAQERGTLSTVQKNSYLISLSEGTCSHCEMQHHMTRERLRIGFVPHFYACLPRSPGFDSRKDCLHPNLVIILYLHR